MSLHQPSLLTPTALRPSLGRAWPFGALQPQAYDLIVADPAWRFELYSERGQTKGAEVHYATMPLADIKTLPVAELAAMDCLLWLWATAPMLPQALETMAAWGFAYCTMGAWHKRTATGKTEFGYGYRLRSACEPFLIGTHGAPKTTHGVRNLVDGVAREHSRKPEEAYAAAEQLMPHARRLELFSRCERPGWDAWGDEVGKFNGEGS